MVAWWGPERCRHHGRFVVGVGLVLGEAKGVRLWVVGAERADSVDGVGIVGTEEEGRCGRWLQKDRCG